MRLVAIASLIALVTTAHAGVGAWTSSGPRTPWRVIAADARAGGTALLGAPGTLYRSTDEGRTWSPSFVPVDAAQLDPQAFAFDSQLPGRVYGALGSFTLFRSDDGGAHWSRLGNAFGSPPVVIGATQRPRVVGLAVAASGIHVLDTSQLQPTIRRSADGGVTWSSTTPPLGGSAFAFALDLAQPLALYATGVGGVQRSMDGGNTWTTINGGLPGDVIGLAIAVDPHAPGRILLIANRPQSAPELYVSNDAGTTWGTTNVVFTTGPATNSRILFDSERAGSMVAQSGPQIARTVDGGNSWQFPRLRNGAGALAVATQGGHVFAAALGDGFMTSDDGIAWVPRNDGLPGAPTRRLGSAGTDPVVPFALVERSTNDTLAMRRGADANVWQPVLVDPLAQTVTAFGTSARGSGRVIASTTFPLRAPRVQSSDAGATWQPLDAGYSSVGNVDGFELSPASDDTIYAVGKMVLFSTTGGYAGTVQRSIDSGRTWRNVTPFPEFQQDIGSLALSASAPGTAYVGAGVNSSWRLLRSIDGGDTWSEITTPASISLGYVNVVVDPGDANRIVAVSGGNGASWSGDAGVTWSAVGATLPAGARAVAVDWSNSPVQVFAGTAKGVYRAALVGNAQWTPVDGSEALDVHALQLTRRSSRMTLSAATQTGVWEYTFDPDRTLAPVYGFRNTATGTEFFTESEEERDLVLASLPQFVFRGVAFSAARSPGLDTIPVHRFYNRKTGAHFYTTSVSERDAIFANVPHFAYEGVRFHALPGEAGTVRVIRAYDATAGVHHFTTQDDAHAAFVQNPGVTGEGARFSVFPASSR